MWILKEKLEEYELIRRSYKENKPNFSKDQLFESLEYNENTPDLTEDKKFVWILQQSITDYEVWENKDIFLLFAKDTDNFFNNFHTLFHDKERGGVFSSWGLLDIEKKWNMDYKKMRYDTDECIKAVLNTYPKTKVSNWSKFWEDYWEIQTIDDIRKFFSKRPWWYLDNYKYLIVKVYSMMRREWYSHLDLWM